MAWPVRGTTRFDPCSRNGGTVRESRDYVGVARRWTPGGLAAASTGSIDNRPRDADVGESGTHPLHAVRLPGTERVQLLLLRGRGVVAGGGHCALDLPFSESGRKWAVSAG